MHWRASVPDVLVASGVLALAGVETFLVAPPAVRAGVGLGAVTVAAALVWRRRYPTASALGVLAGNVLVDALMPSEALWPVLALIISMYSAGRHAALPRAVGVLVGGLVFGVLVGVGEDAGSAGQWVLNYLFIAVLMVGGPWLAGALLSRRERQSTEAAEKAVLDERLRMARELHDVVGHSLGAIAVQAGAERMTLREDAPQSTRETLVAIESATHEALAEMRRLVKVMRTAEGPGALQPQPSLADLDDVLAAARRAGWRTLLRVEGSPRALSPGADLAGYRIVQEAVTNALRHSHGHHLTVTVRYLGEDLQLEVANDGTPAAHPPGAGFGLTGMRERARLYGGDVTTRSDGHEGFVVLADLPYTHGGPTS